MHKRAKLRTVSHAPQVSMEYSHQSGLSDEDIDSDGAFDSSDDEKYGDFIDSKNNPEYPTEPDDIEDIFDADDVEDTDDWLSKVFRGKSDETEENDRGEDDQDDEGVEDASNHQALATFIDSMSTNSTKEADLKLKAKRRRLMSQKTTESEYSGNAFKSDDSNDQLTINRLLADTITFQTAGMVKRLEGLSQSGVTVPLPSQVSLDKSTRKLAYKSSKQEITSRWQHLVSLNRAKPTIDFYNDVRSPLEQDEFSSSYEPRHGSYEEAVDMILVKTGMDDDEKMMEKERIELLRRDDDDDDDVNKRQAELSRLGHLLHSYERKRHFAHQIKSKSYRRIRRRVKDDSLDRQATVLRQVDPTLFSILQEQEATRRVEERMTMKKRSLKQIAMADSRLEMGQFEEGRYATSTSSDRAMERIALEVDGKSKLQTPDDDDDGDGGDDDKSQKKSRLAKVAAGTRFGNLFALKFMQNDDGGNMKRKADDDDDDDNNDDDDDDVRLATTDDQLKESQAIVSSLLSSSSNRLSTAISSSLKSSSSSSSLKSSSSTSSPSSSSQHKGQSISVRTAGVPSNHHQLKTNNINHNDDDRLIIELVPDGDNEYNIPPTKPNTTTSKKPSSSSSLSIPDMTQSDLISMAFADNSLESDFIANKAVDVNDEVDADLAEADGMGKKGGGDDAAGWGDWTGLGSETIPVSFKTKQKRARLSDKKKKQVLQLAIDKAKVIKERKDARLPLVTISEKRIKTSDKYRIRAIPFPFTSAEQYERSMEMPLGAEWNALGSVKRNTQPEVRKRRGRIIDPIQPAKKA